MYSTLKQDFLQSAETAGTYSYLAEATNLIQRLGELGVSTFVDSSQEDEEDAMAESPPNNDDPTIQEGTNATTPQSNDVRTALEMTDSKAGELLDRVNRLLVGVKSWKNLGATRVPDDVIESEQESLECLHEVVTSVKELVDIDDRLRAVSSN
jgi:hypothetical protein